MAYQAGRDIAVSYAPESTFGVPPAQGAASKYLRVNGGGTSLTKEAIRSNEVRRDGMLTRGRHGSRTVQGSYPVDLSLGACDDPLQAAFRGTFDTPITSTTANIGADSATKTFTRSAGSWITDGFRVGDVVRAAGFAGAGVANNTKNLRVTALTATVMTVAEALTTIAAAAGVTFTRPKKLLNGMVQRSFSLEENELDIVGSMLFVGVRMGGWALSMQPNGMAVLTFTLVGQDMQLKTGGQSPYYTAPTITTAVAMTAVEAVIRLGTTDVLDVTSLDLSQNLNASGVPVVGSVITPEVFTNAATTEGSITALKSDISRMQSFLNEDQLSLHLLFTELEAEPKDFCSFFVGNLTLGSATPSEIGGDNARTQTLTLMPGADDRGGAYDQTMVKYQTSAI